MHFSAFGLRAKCKNWFNPRWPPKAPEKKAEPGTPMDGRTADCGDVFPA